MPWVGNYSAMRMTLLRAPRERKIYYLWVSEMCGERGAESLDFLASPLDPADFTDASVLLLLTQVLLRILKEVIIHVTIQNR